MHPELIPTVHAMLTPGKGLLAMDESTPTCHKRFATLGIPQTEEYRRAWRELIVTTPGLGEGISGAILVEETLRQSAKDGRPFVQCLQKAGIVPGIKVDAGAHALAGFPGEKVTDGLDGLRGRLKEYFELGARFAKWRAVIIIGEGIPTQGCLEANCHALARYAALCQEAGIVPIVEPEVLMDGAHTLERCGEVTEEALVELFGELFEQRVDLRATILKPNMVLPGKDCPTQDSVDAVANATVRCLLKAVPHAVPGVAFLSGGQTPELATERLNAMRMLFPKTPWAVTFSYSRATQQPALDLWAGKPENMEAVQKMLYRRAKLNGLAQKGEYKPEMENAPLG
jgi:fructose-bisphosphate aldolase class I